jgi:hypothetical protein
MDYRFTLLKKRPLKVQQHLWYLNHHVDQRAAPRACLVVSELTMRWLGYRLSLISLGGPGKSNEVAGIIDTKGR